MDILATSFHPGISISIMPKTGGVRPQLGVGAFFYRASIKFDDNQESITWKGNKMGVHATLGLDVKMLPSLGLSLSVLYRNAKIDELKDENDRPVIWFDTGRPFALDFSGIEFRAGGYLAF